MTPTPRCVPRPPRCWAKPGSLKRFRGLIKLLADASARVRFFAAIALGKLGRPQAVEPLLALLRANDDKDPYLRHAGVMGLAGSGKTAAWMKAIHDESPAVRMGVLLALRRAGDPEIARFLDDPDPRLVLEAARAIHDVPIEPAMPRLASLPVTASAPASALAASLECWLSGWAGPSTPPRWPRPPSEPICRRQARALALELLARWAKPPGRDAVVGLWRPIAARPAQPAAAATLAQARRTA